MAEAPRWGDYYALTSLASGISWGYAGYAFYLPDSTPHQVFLFTSTIGLVAGSIPLSSNWMRSYFAFTLPAMCGMVLRMMIEGGAANIGLLVLFLMYLGIAISIAKNTNRSMRESIGLRYQNLELVEKYRESCERAEQASRDKTRFLASASHDLRQPVHSLALLEEAAREEMGSVRGKELLCYMSVAINALNELLTSLLDISKLDAGAVVPQKSALHLDAMLRDLSREFSPQAESKGVTIRYRPCRFWVESDGALLGGILRNLLSNAVRYTDKGSILVACRRRAGKALIQIWDTGVGIPASEHERIFLEFNQLQNPERDRSKGLGLGLAICRRLADLLGHRLELRSIEGRGSVFTVEVPLAKPPLRDRTAATPASPWDIRGLSVLVIEDDQAVLRSMEAILGKWGCDVMSAGSIEIAEQRIAEKPEIDLILADYRLRDNTNGVQAIERVRTKLNRNVPAILITGDTAPDRINEARRSGNVLLHKPVAPAVLRNAINAQVRSEGTAGTSALAAEPAYSEPPGRL